MTLYFHGSGDLQSGKQNLPHRLEEFDWSTPASKSSSIAEAVVGFTAVSACALVGTLAYKANEVDTTIIPYLIKSFSN